MVEMNILSKPMPKRRRAAGGQDSEESVAFFLAFVLFLKVFMACGIHVFPQSIGSSILGYIFLGYNYALISLCIYILATNGAGSKSYPEFVKSTFDSGTGCFPKASKVFKIFVIVFGFTFSFCVCSIYLSFIASHICQVISINTSALDNINLRLLIVILAIFLIVLCFIPIWSSLAMYIVALVGLIFQVVAIAIGLFYLLDNRSSSQTFDVGLEGILWVGGFIVYASEGINLVFPLMAAMKNPDKFLGCPSLLCAGMITLAAFAVVLVMAGSYSTYNVVFFIFLGTPTSTLGQAVKICAAAGIFCTYPIQLNVAYHFIVDELDIDNKDLVKYGLRALLAVLTILFALMSPPHIQYFMGVIGSLCLSFLTFIMPGLIPFCTKNYGKAYWMAVVAVLAFVRGAMLLLSWLNISLKWTQADFSNYQTYC